MARYSPNPFYVHPGGDLSRGLDGLGQVLAENRAAKEEKAAQEAQQQRIQMAQQAARQALQSGDPMMVADVAMEYPEVADMLNKQAGIIDDAKKQDATQFSMALLAAAPEDRAAVYQQRIKQLSDQGRDPSHTMQSYRDYLVDPEREIRGVETMFAASNPDAYKSYREATTVKPAETREIKRGDRIVTEQWDGEKWVQIADADRFNPNSGVRVDVNTGDSGPQFGNIPPSYMMVQTEEGWQQVPVPGGEADREIKALEEKRRNSKTNETSTANLVSEDIGRAKRIINESPNLTTGFLGPIVSKWGGSPAADLDSLLDTVGANISFDYLNTMRQNSPTGGALGNVTERELDLLRATAGNLRQSQSADQLLFNLDRLEKQFNKVIHGSETAPGANAGVPDGVDPELWEFMTPEQKALWK